MDYKISTATLVIMVIEMFMAFLLPFILFFIMKFKKNVKAKPFFIGFLTMLVFSFILKNLVSLGISSVAGELMNNVWFYGLMGGLLAGIFEETGRFVSMKYILKKEQDNDYNAIAYGLGHGGIELMFILGISTIGNLTIALMISSGNIDVIMNSLTSASDIASLKASCETLCNTSPAMFLISPLERASAYIMQIALSVIVWLGVKNNEKASLAIAIGLHVVMDASGSIVYMLTGSYFVEILILAIAILTAWYAYGKWKENHS